MFLLAKGRLTRKLIAGATVLGVLGLAWLPPEHVHITRTHGDHHADVVHRHFESHHPIGNEVRVGDDDDDVRWLDGSSFTYPKPAPHIYPVDQVLTEIPSITP